MIEVPRLVRNRHPNEPKTTGCGFVSVGACFSRGRYPPTSQRLGIFLWSRAQCFHRPISRLRRTLNHQLHFHLHLAEPWSPGGSVQRFQAFCFASIPLKRLLLQKLVSSRLQKEMLIPAAPYSRNSVRDLVFVSGTEGDGDVEQIKLKSLTN